MAAPVPAALAFADQRCAFVREGGKRATLVVAGEEEVEGRPRAARTLEEPGERDGEEIPPPAAPPAAPPEGAGEGEGEETEAVPKPGLALLYASKKSFGFGY